MSSVIIDMGQGVGPWIGEIDADLPWSPEGYAADALGPLPVVAIATPGGAEGRWWDGAQWVAAVRDPSARGGWAACPVVVPVVTCTPRQGRLALDAAGLLDDVEAWIATQPRAVQIDYELATEWRRDWPLIEDVRMALEWTHEEVDALFATAQTL